MKLIDTTVVANLLTRSGVEEEDDIDTTSADSDQSSEGSSSDDEMFFFLSTRCLVQQKRYLSTRKNFPKTTGLADVIFRADEKTFKKNARMTRQAFFGIVEIIKDHSIFQNKSRYPQADPADQLMIALGRLGFHGNSHRCGQLAPVSESVKVR